jgi:hypothetical protein
MIYKFLILSDEVDDFLREISIDAEATFLDFQNAILDSVKYTKDQMTSFFICADNWEKEQEITLVEMDSSSEYDNVIMSETQLQEYISDEEQKLLFVFDYLLERAFFIELKEIILGKDLKKPVCSLAKGNAPQQLMDDLELDNILISNTLTNDDSFYGDEEFDMDELDEEGFSGFEGSEPSEEMNF